MKYFIQVPFKFHLDFLKAGPSNIMHDTFESYYIVTRSFMGWSAGKWLHKHHYYCCANSNLPSLIYKQITRERQHQPDEFKNKLDIICCGSSSESRDVSKYASQTLKQNSQLKVYSSIFIFIGTKFYNFSTC